MLYTGANPARLTDTIGGAPSVRRVDKKVLDINNGHLSQGAHAGR